MPAGGMLTDIDGTISEISSHPDTATVEEDAREALSGLTQKLTLVGAVSGRSAEDARNLVGLDEIVYSGNHGMEIWRNGRLEKSPIASRYTPRITTLLDQLEITKRIAELYVEHKGLTASIHYRGVDEPKKVETELLQEVESAAAEHELLVTRGRMVVEIRPPVDISKGTSVLELIDEYQLDGLIYIGDDVTDVDAFRAIRDRRATTGKHYYSIGVKSDATPEEVINLADSLVTGVGGVVNLLRVCIS
jgi:trehalose 6-phosphate phosphatase